MSRVPERDAIGIQERQDHQHVALAEFTREIRIAHHDVDELTHRDRALHLDRVLATEQ